MRYLLITLFSLLLANCSHHHRHNHANEHMNKMDFQELVQRFESPERDKWQKPEVVLQKMGKLQGMTVAEIGAGTGYFTFKLAKKAKRVIAADVDERFLDYIDAKKKKYPGVSAKIQTLKIPYDSPDLPKNSFDKLLIVDVYHHIENRTEYFSKLKSIMKDSAQLFIIDFKMGSKFGPPDGMKVSPKEVRNELAKAGFDIVEIDNNSLPQQFIIKAVPMGNPGH